MVTTDMPGDHPRLIERAFPLKQTSLDSVHEKNVRHGHISTLHVWPARRPLAACRAALIATLLPDPGTPEARRKLVERIGGRVIKASRKKRQNGQTTESVQEETLGGVLHWKREESSDLALLRDAIRDAYGGRSPRVLDPFAGGGAIPLEAMRLGCEVGAVDLDEVAWFLLRCTLSFPRQLSGQRRPLPDFVLQSPELVTAYFKGTGRLTKRQLESRVQAALDLEISPPDADLVWHIRAWGHWVREEARKELASYYPTVNGAPTAAYLWARTVKCKNCRATIPLLKTLWLCRKDRKRVKLDTKQRPDKSGVDFEIVLPPVVGGNAAQRREYDRKIGAGTMTKSGVWCPVCGQPEAVSLTMGDIRIEGKNGHIGRQMTAVAIQTKQGIEYRLPTNAEITSATPDPSFVRAVYEELPFGLPEDPIAPESTRSISCHLYGLDHYSKLFTERGLLAVGVFARVIRSLRHRLRDAGYPPEWQAALFAYMSLALSRSTDYWGSLATWAVGGEFVRGTFARFAFPMVWDHCEVNPCTETSGGFDSAVDWIARGVEHLLTAESGAPSSHVTKDSADALADVGAWDAIITDPPYYQAISYGDLADYFYVWLRRLLGDVYPEVFNRSLTDKDREIVQHIRGDKDKTAERIKYENRMAEAFERCHRALRPDGRFVAVFAHKDPEAWETLVSAIIRAGFAVTASWPIQTERLARSRALSAAALSSSVWLVCRKRAESARPGWDNRVLEEMRSNIHARLREYWDAGIRGPDFVWAATGPALESYSAHPIVKKANAPNEVMTVSEFLREVRRIVVDFVVGRVLSRNGDGEIVSDLDDTTIYYLLHRYDFGFADAPAGAVILYAGSCGLSDASLCDREVLIKSGGQPAEEDEEPDSESDEKPEEGTGSTMRLRPWHHRKRESLGLSTEGRPAPLIDQTHRLMRLWKAGDVHRVDAYIEENGLRRNELFHRLLQSLIELARRDNQADECTILESISNHVAARGVAPERPTRLFDMDEQAGN
jgi:adenine-specific DNA methylase